MNIAEWITAITSASILIIIYCYLKPKLKKIEEFEKEILDLQDEIDDMPKIVHSKHNGNINQSQADAIIARDIIPLEVKKNKLMTMRQFELDKIPLVSLFKK